MDGHNVCSVDSDAQGPFADTVEWAKRLVATGLTEEIVVELIELLRRATDGRAEMAAWALGFGEVPGHLRESTVHALLEVLIDMTRAEAVRGQVAEAVAEQLAFSRGVDPLRRAAETRLIETLTDASSEVRFWSAFALGTLRTRRALPQLRTLTGDETPLPGWWTVGEEAADAIDRIDGREPPDRLRASG